MVNRTGKTDHNRQKRWLWWALLVLVIAAVMLTSWWQEAVYYVIAGIWSVAVWFGIDSDGKVENSEVVRNLALTIFPLSGLVVAVMGYMLARQRLNNEEQTRNDERYARAVEMLGHEHLSVRLGGILKIKQLGRMRKNHLEHALRSLEVFMRDRGTIVHYGAYDGKYETIPLTHEDEDLGSVRCKMDMQEALIAYGTLLRVWDNSDGKQPPDALSRNLRALNFAGFDGPRGLYLAGCKLENTDLCGATLVGVNLSEAALVKANLTGADLDCADMSGALLYNADLSGAYLPNANLSRSILFGAKITCRWDEEDENNLMLNEARFDVEQTKSLHALGWPIFDPRKMTFFESYENAREGTSPLSEADLRVVIGSPSEG